MGRHRHAETGLPRDWKRGADTLNPWDGRGLRDKKFDPEMYTTPESMIEGMDHSYSLIYNNCVDIATKIFRRVAGADLTDCNNALAIRDPDQLLLLMKKSGSYVPGTGPPPEPPMPPRIPPMDPVGTHRGSGGNLIWNE